ncbi:hypothetical protein B0J14DRAFT_468361 [Halenospora varia]|nr:hypothetical protein B0J14DRAFT_468361 [Halenospora varia]
MASETTRPSSEELIAKLTHQSHYYPGSFKAIEVMYGDKEYIQISLRRTVRVPDNDETYHLPPDCGAFPIYSVNQYKSKLPTSMAGKGGVFIPIYCNNIYAGGVNAVSGEHFNEDENAKLRRKEKLAKGESIQDYVVIGPNDDYQWWLDGIAKSDGKVMQFVAAQVDTGYSVEAQITGKDSIGGLQIEIIPVKRNSLSVFIKSFGYNTFRLEVDEYMTVEILKELVEERGGPLPVDQRVVFEGDQLIDCTSNPLMNMKVHHDSTLEVTIRIHGGGVVNKTAKHRPSIKERLQALDEYEMAVAVGGFVNQTIIKDPILTKDWDKDNTIMFNIQLLNAGFFEHLLGIPPPSTSHSGDYYSDLRLPFFEHYEEPSGINGEFWAVKSVGQIELAKGRKRLRDGDKDLVFPVVGLNTVDERAPFIPLAELEAALEDVEESEDERVVKEELEYVEKFEDLDAYVALRVVVIKKEPGE